MFVFVFVCPSVYLFDWLFVFFVSLFGRLFICLVACLFVFVFVFVSSFFDYLCSDKCQNSDGDFENDQQLYQLSCVPLQPTTF